MGEKLIFFNNSLKKMNPLEFLFTCFCLVSLSIPISMLIYIICDFIQTVVLIYLYCWGTFLIEPHTVKRDLKRITKNDLRTDFIKSLK
jgi:hypothetical protein